MYFKDFTDENEVSDELKQDIFKQAEKTFACFDEKLQRAIFDDIENWLYERLENVERRFFDNIVGFFMGRFQPSNKEKLENWLKEIGCDVSDFRYKIYQENKNVINEAIAEEITYDTVKNMFNNYFGCWKWSDIKKGYPQSMIMRDFTRCVSEQKVEGFNEYLLEILDSEVKEKQRELKELQNKISECENILYD